MPLDLASGLDFALEFCEDFRARGYALFLPPTAAEELWLLHRNALRQQQQRLAAKALQNLSLWGISLLELKLPKSVARSLCRAFANRLILGGHLPPDEINDGVIVAEAALAEIPLLVTRDRHLLDIEAVDLLLCLQAADLPPTQIVHPRALWKALQ